MVIKGCKLFGKAVRTHGEAFRGLEQKFNHMEKAFGEVVERLEAFRVTANRNRKMIEMLL